MGKSAADVPVAHAGDETVAAPLRHSRSDDARLLDPPHPERICWGCDKFCPAADLACGNGTIRTPHPKEIFGDDWLEWSEASATPNTPR